MIDDIEKQHFYPDLTFMAKEATKELLKRYSKFQAAKKMGLIIFLLSSIAIFIIVPSRIQSYSSATFLIVAVIICVIAYLIELYIANIAKSYKQQKDIMIKLLATNFCSHSKNCTCKDQLIEYLYKKHINTIF